MHKKPFHGAPLYKHSELTEQIIGAFYDVYSKLGYGFLEGVYVKALAVEHEAQLLNYLKATPYEVGLLLISDQSLKQNDDHSTTAEKNGFLRKTDHNSAFFSVHQRPDSKRIGVTYL
jgi:hypothetical protein